MDEQALSVSIEVKELDRTLQASREWPVEDRKRLFREKVKLWHPDKSDSAFATQVFQWLHEQKKWYLPESDSRPSSGRR